jgi:hypothetical protein
VYFFWQPCIFYLVAMFAPTCILYGNRVYLSGGCLYIIWQLCIFLSGKCVCGHFIWQPRVFYAAVMYFYMAVVCIVICILSDNRVYFIWQLCIFYLAVTCILSGSRMYSVVYPVSSLQMYVIIFSG